PIRMVKRRFGARTARADDAHASPAEAATPVTRLRRPTIIVEGPPRSGAAMKIEEEVPTTIPKSITQANPEIDSPPNSAKGRLARNTVIDVPRVRFKVSLIDRSISSRSGIDL